MPVIISIEKAIYLQCDECGEELRGTIRSEEDYFVLDVSPCPRCKSEARLQGREEGAKGND